MEDIAILKLPLSKLIHSRMELMFFIVSAEENEKGGKQVWGRVERIKKRKVKYKVEKKREERRKEK